MEIPVCTGWINPKETADESFQAALPKDHDSVLFSLGRNELVQAHHDSLTPGVQQ